MKMRTASQFQVVRKMVLRRYRCHRLRVSAWLEKMKTSDCWCHHLQVYGQYRRRIHFYQNFGNNLLLKAVVVLRENPLYILMELEPYCPGNITHSSRLNKLISVESCNVTGKQNYLFRGRRITLKYSLRYRLQVLRVRRVDMILFIFLLVLKFFQLEDRQNMHYIGCSKVNQTYLSVHTFFLAAASFSALFISLIFRIQGYYGKYVYSVSIYMIT